MPIVEKLSAIKLPFVAGPKPEEDERLMQLFRNRAGLKKQHASLQDEFFELKEKLKQQEKAAQRAEEQMESLETLLGNPGAGFGALVFFQLRGVWRACYLQLDQFAGELERQQEERERRKQIFEFNQDLKARLAAVDERIVVAEGAENEQREILSALEQQRARLKGFWNYFRRRRLLQQFDRPRTMLAQAQQGTAAIRDERTLLEQEQCPPFPGLSVEGRRAINLAIIAYALVLGGRLAVKSLATHAKDAVARRVNDAQYGSRAECESLMAAIAQALDMIRSRKELAGEIKICVDALRTAAQYRSDSDTVPLVESLGGVAPSPPDGGGGAMTLSAPQILADDYWHIYKVLLR